MLNNRGAWFMKVSRDVFRFSLGGTSMLDLVLWLDVFEKIEERLAGLPVSIILRARASVVYTTSW